VESEGKVEASPTYKKQKQAKYLVEKRTLEKTPPKKSN
jgi:hypothetical protein